MRVEVDFYQTSARVAYEIDKVGVDQIVDAVHRAGFRASVANSASTPVPRSERGR